MNIGEKLYELRKKKGISQEELASLLGVSRQTVSKWETNQSTPDFDKILPLCAIYGITADSLLKGIQEEKIGDYEESDNSIGKIELKKKRALGIGLSVLLYFVAIVWIMISIPVFMVNPIVSSGIFLLICGVATFVIIYTSMVYKYKKEKKEESPNKKVKEAIQSIIAMIVLVIYLLLSFTTMAWHITWVLWVIYGLISEIIDLVFIYKENENAK